mgnify:CR=1 FL=1
MSQGAGDGVQRYSEGVDDPTVGSSLDALVAALDAEAPQMLRDRYLLTQVLGRGGLGIVISAWDPELERKVAIKLVRVGGHARDRVGACERMLGEARALAQLSHPHVVSVFDVGRYDDDQGRLGVFIVMEQLEGPSLHDWLQDERTPEQILQMFAGAGRGLAAAHAAGLVHRDFKPANVVLDGRGVPKVVDFGLALASGVTYPSVPSSPDSSTTSPLPASASGRSNRATATGVVMGTPRYMAPEQHAGEPLGPAADQYAFCVSLWEALRGGKVFVGATLGDLSAAKRLGSVSPPPASDATPRALVSVLERGLDPDPDARWPSMTALLAALAPRRRAGRGWGVAAGALGVGAVVAAAAFAGADPCRAIETSVSTKAIAEVETQLRANATDATRERVATSLRARASAIGERMEAACMAHRDGSIDAAQLDRRSSCLREADAELTEAVTVMSETASLTGEAASAIVAGLGSLSGCEDDERLAAGLAPPDPSIEVQVARLRANLRRVAMLQRAARTDEADRLFDDTERAAAELGYAPLQVEIADLRALDAVLAGDFARAQGLYEPLLAEAQAIGHDVIAAKAASAMVFIVGVGLGRADEGLERAEAAEALLQRAGNPPLTRARFLSALGAIAYGKHDFERAFAHFDDALEVLRAMPERDLGEETIVMANHASALMSSGDLEAAASLQERSLAIREELLGPDHPKIGMALLNLANTRTQQGRMAEAEKLYHRTIAIFEAAGDRGERRLAYPLIGLGLAYKKQGRFDEALVYYERAAQAAEKAYGPDHEIVGTSLRNRAIVEKRRGNLDRARELSAQAVRHLEARVGEDHPELATLLTGRGHILRESKLYEEAAQVYERAAAIYSKAGIEDGRVATTLIGLANLALAQGDRETARDRFTRADALYREAGDPERVFADYGLGRILLSEGEPAEAEPRLEAAAAGLAELGDHAREAHHARALWGRALWEIGRRAEGRRELEAAMAELDADDPDRGELDAWRAANL